MIEVKFRRQTKKKHKSSRKIIETMRLKEQKTKR